MDDLLQHCSEPSFLREGEKRWGEKGGRERGRECGGRKGEREEES